ncbi:DsbA family protein [Hyalangium minutum]|uniref:Periplasmic thiol:disulfide interchange protein DsbA n=1 Tax=Hyalangium minutum TaxID=394096 RepID=A0A085WF03_9BACT|nr:thioredoxin domain-containing protein [Hyalangium minutum]KFE66266.1 Periplasmic thiol:disulfide interchange protein DsbA [Hyalangium minutum]
MKVFLSAGAAVAVLLGVSAIAVASSPSPSRHDDGCSQKDCPESHGGDTRPQPLAATPRAEAPSLGPADAKVTVEVWSDFQCPFCARGATTAKELRAKYGDQVRLVFRHQPLPMHGQARLAAAASMAAHEQGRFWEFHDALFANQRALDRASLEALAAKLNLDMERFKRSLDSSTWSNYVDTEVAEAQRRGVRGTPTFFVNGQPITGAQPLQVFTQAIDAELRR